MPRLRVVNCSRRLRRQQAEQLDVDTGFTFIVQEISRLDEIPSPLLYNLWTKVDMATTGLDFRPDPHEWLRWSRRGDNRRYDVAASVANSPPVSLLPCLRGEQTERAQERSGLRLHLQDSSHRR